MTANIEALTATTLTVLHEIETHTYNLGMGLQSAAPVVGNGQPPNSIVYLFEIAKELEKTRQALSGLSVAPDSTISNNSNKSFGP